MLDAALFAIGFVFEWRTERQTLFGTDVGRTYIKSILYSGFWILLVLIHNIKATKTIAIGLSRTVEYSVYVSIDMRGVNHKKRPRGAEGRQTIQWNGEKEGDGENNHHHFHKW